MGGITSIEIASKGSKKLPTFIDEEFIHLLINVSDSSNTIVETNGIEYGTTYE